MKTFAVIQEETEGNTIAGFVSAPDKMAAEAKLEIAIQKGNIRATDVEDCRLIDVTEMLENKVQ